VDACLPLHTAQEPVGGSRKETDAEEHQPPGRRDDEDASRAFAMRSTRPQTPISADTKSVPSANTVHRNVTIARATSVHSGSLKMLVWQDAAGRVWISYNSTQYLQADMVFRLNCCRISRSSKPWQPRLRSRSRGDQLAGFGFANLTRLGAARRGPE
jgi:hypothetical protein